MTQHELRCEWCYGPYDPNKSDAMDPKRWCGLPCQMHDDYLEERAKKSE